MPKPKPTQVIRHEIVFGRSQMDLLEPALYAYTARNASRAWFNLTSDMSSVVVTIILYEWITNKSTGILDAIDDTADSAYSWMIRGWNNYRSSPEYQEQYQDRAHSVGGGLQNLWDNIISSLSGADIARWAEEREGQ